MEQLITQGTELDKILFEKLPEEFRSGYLSCVYNNEQLVLHDLIYAPKDETLIARLDVTKPCIGEVPENVLNMPGFSSGFHLSAFTAYVAISQLAIAYGCIKTGKPKSELGEFIQRGFTMKNKKAVTETMNIPLVLRLTDFKRLGTTGQGTLAGFAYDVAHGSASGDLRGLLPGK